MNSLFILQVGQSVFCNSLKFKNRLRENATVTQSEKFILFLKFSIVVEMLTCLFSFKNKFHVTMFWMKGSKKT